MKNDINDAVILAARLFLATLFLIFGWRKLRDYSGTVSQIMRDGAPMPALAAAIAIFMELPVAFAIALGAFTRASAPKVGFCTRWEPRLSSIAIGKREARINSPAWRPFRTRTSALSQASCCCTLPVRENTRSMLLLCIAAR